MEKLAIKTVGYGRIGQTFSGIWDFRTPYKPPYIIMQCEKFSSSARFICCDWMWYAKAARSLQIRSDRNPHATHSHHKRNTCAIQSFYSLCIRSAFAAAFSIIGMPTHTIRSYTVSNATYTLLIRHGSALKRYSGKICFIRS